MQGEYRGDFTRDTFDRRNHFCRVLMQQGRVQLDADWNEQNSILLHFLRGLASDLIGPHGGPGDGFKILPYNPSVAPKLAANQTWQDFIIQRGRYYVNGIECENQHPVLTAVYDPSNANVITVAGGFGRENMPDLQGAYLEFSIDNFQSVSGIKGMLGVKTVDKSELSLTVFGDLPQLPTQKSTIYLRRLTSFTTQKNYPNPVIKPNDSQPPPAYLVYLDVWERHVSSVEHGSIREVALGGLDTASRSQVVWQIKLAALTTVPSIQQPMSLADWNELFVQQWQPVNRGSLKAQIQPQVASNSPCVISPSSKFRGPENQLYRIEIHTGGTAWDGSVDNGVPITGTATATFKWSRENGSVIFPILSASNGATVLSLANLGRDERLSLSEGDWVEVVDDDYTLQTVDRPATAPLYQIKSVDAVAIQVTLEQPLQGNTGSNSGKHPYLRKWDQQPGDSSQNGITLHPKTGSALVVEGTGAKGWLNLEDGIQIQFQSPPGGTKPTMYRAGDYWLVPARVATGDLLWPVLRDAQGKVFPDANTGQPTPDSLPPHGTEHHYAPLGVVSTTVMDSRYRQAIQLPLIPTTIFS